MVQETERELQEHCKIKVPNRSLSVWLDCEAKPLGLCSGLHGDLGPGVVQLPVIQCTAICQYANLRLDE
jgi:hypothetical protein